jgi:hypothetical protein
VYIVKHNYILGGMIFTIREAHLHFFLGVTSPLCIDYIVEISEKQPSKTQLKYLISRTRTYNKQHLQRGTGTQPTATRDYIQHIK